jgi:hypothetical protein
VEKFLKNLDSQLSPIDRDSSFGLAWAEGMKALSDAQELDGTERQARLVQSCDKFILAIHHARSRPEPYLGMAYLLTILEDYHSAGKYVRQALHLAPNYPEAEDLNRLIQTCSVVTDAFADLSELCLVAGMRMEEIHPEDQDLNCEDLYAKTETLLYTQLQLVDHEPPPEVVIRTEALAEIKHSTQELAAFTKGIRRRVEILEQHMAVTELVLQLEKLEAISQKYQACLQTSQKLAEISDWVKQDFKLLTRHVIQLRMHTSAEEVARAERFDAELQKRYEEITQIMQALDPQIHAQFSEEISFDHLLQQRENFQQLLDTTRRRVHMPNQ